MFKNDAGLRGQWSCIVVVLATLACSGTPPPSALPPQTVTPLALSAESQPEAEPAPAPEATEEASQVPAKETEQEEGKADDKDPTLVVITPQEVQDEVSLIEASRAERQRRRSAPQPIAVITDKNLAEFAEGAHVTMVEEPVAEPYTPGEDDEEYWRHRGLEIRLGWRDTVKEIEELEDRVAELRRQFYEEDDPFIRDEEIKPAWDRKLDLLDEARRREAAYQAELDSFLEDGRRAGALPGWLREGAELEPRDEEAEEVPEHDPGEPQVINDN